MRSRIQHRTISAWGRKPRHLCRRSAGAGARACAGLLLGVLLSLPAQAQAQWAWRDSSGRTTYSDAPPPADVKPADILRQPPPPDNAPLPNAAANGYGSGGPANAATSPAAEPRKAGPPPKTWAEQEADFRKRLAERERARQKVQEEEEQVAARTSRCAQARSYVQTLDSGMRIMRPDDQGNRNFLDDAQRASERQKAQDSIDKNC